MKQIKLLFLLASASVTGAFAQSNGLTDMSQSRYAKMANTGIDAVHWTNGFWGERFNVFSGTSLQSMWNTWNTPEVSHGFRNFEIQNFIRTRRRMAEEAAGKKSSFLPTATQGNTRLIFLMDSKETIRMGITYRFV